MTKGQWSECMQDTMLWLVLVGLLNGYICYTEYVDLKCSGQELDWGEALKWNMKLLKLKCKITGVEVLTYHWSSF